MNKKIFITSLIIMLLIPLLIPFNIKHIKAYDVGGTSPILGVNINVIGYDYERVYDAFYPVAYVTTQENEKAIWRCTNFNSTSNACLQWANDYSSGNIPGETQLNFTYMANPVSLLDVNYAKYTYEYEFILDNYYVGYVQMSSNYTYDHESALTHKTKKYLVNGTSFKVSGTAWYDGWTVSSYNLTKIDWNNVPQNIEDIENYLIDIGNYTDELEEILNDMKAIEQNILDKQQYYFPVESLSAIMPYFKYNYPIKTLSNYNYWTFPIFSLQTGDEVFRTTSGYSGFEVWFICASNKDIKASNITNHFNYSGLTCLGYTNLGLILIDGETWRIGKYRFSIDTLSTTISVTAKRNMDIIPIFLGRPNYDYYPTNASTDFALTFDLSNKLLDNLDLIANGNTISNNSVSNADTTNQSASTTFQQEEQIVSNAETDLSSKLNDLDIANKNNNLFSNDKFIKSANWVKTQFGYFTNNNAFGYLITFSLVIGIALVIIGKLRG